MKKLLTKRDWMKAHSRKSDPITSFEAGDSMIDTIPAQHKAIMSVMADGKRRAAEEIEDVLGYPVWRRLSELVSSGLLTRTDERHKNRSGRSAFRYEKHR